MKQAAPNSLAFVITAIYTFTFGNAGYRVLEFNESTIGIGFRQGITVENALYSLVCLTMALRFFFGNNSYVEHVFASPMGPRSRAYHVGIVILQSLVLMGSSHHVTSPVTFLTWMAILFSLEVLWYIGCVLFIRRAVQRNGRLNMSLLAAEATNLALAAVATVAAVTSAERPATATFVFIIMFIVNTAVDLRVNFVAYMGERAVAT
jgi:hypothetical protein